LNYEDDIRIFVLTEIELKLQLSPDSIPFLLRHPLLESLSASNPVTHKVYSIYYDTPDMHLRHSGLAFRLRRAGRQWFQTIKGGGSAAAGLHQRKESEVQVVKAQPDFTKIVDPSSARLFASTALREQLQPLFITDFHRTTRLLRFPDGSEAEFCLDRGKIVAGSRNIPVCEIELELRCGSIPVLFQFALDLLHSVPFRLESMSKAERGYALVTGSEPPPVKAVPVRLRAEMSANEAFGTIAWNCLSHLHGNEAGMLQGRDAEYLHQMRVGLRRLRSSVSLFSPIYSGIACRSLDHELRWLWEALSSARDWDVFVTEAVGPVSTHFLNLPGMAELKDRCGKRRQHYNREAQGAVESQRYTELMLKLSIFVCTASREESFFSEPRHSTGSKLKTPVREFAAPLLERRRRQSRRYGKRLASLSEPELHALRIVVKKHRYAAEFFAGVYPQKEAKRYIQALSGIQDMLGIMNDAANVRRLLDEVSLENDGEGLHEARGIILGWSASLAPRDKGQLMDAWVNFTEKKSFW
jgi:inorganic triphosphatase YgiF